MTTPCISWAVAADLLTDSDTRLHHLIVIHFMKHGGAHAPGAPPVPTPMCISWAVAADLLTDSDTRLHHLLLYHLLAHGEQYFSM